MRRLTDLSGDGRITRVYIAEDIPSPLIMICWRGGGGWGIDVLECPCLEVDDPLLPE